MVSSYTSRNRLNKQGTGDNTNTWGDVLNTGALELIDAALDGWATIPVSGSRTLTSTNGAADEARSRALKFTGTGGTVTLPSVEKNYLVWNATTGNVTLTNGGPTTVTLESGDKLPVLTDGAGVFGLAIGGLALKAYIDAATLAATGSLPAAAGNEGKALMVRSGAWTPSVVDIGDVARFRRRRLIHNKEF